MDERDDKNKVIKRYTLIVVATFLVGLAIVLRTSYTMFANNNYWKKVAARYEIDSLAVHPLRGNITACDGQLLATTLPEYKLYMDFKADGLVKKDTLLTNHWDDISQSLHELFPDKSASYFKARLKEGYRKKRRYHMIYPYRISYMDYLELKEIPFFKRGSNNSGLIAEKIENRNKPFGSLAERTIGDVFKQSGKARSGLELSFDSVLRGKEGVRHLRKVKNSFLSIIDKEAVNGLDVVTTIDVEIQDIAEKVLKDKLKEINANYGSAIVMEVETGEIKAIVNLDKVADSVYVENINHAFGDLMDPGSTFKTASLLVALDDGYTTPSDSIDTGDGEKLMYGSYMRDHNHHRGGYGVISTTQALMYSSNVAVSAIIDRAYHDQPEKFVEGLYRLGLTEDYKIPLSDYNVARIRMPNKETWYKTTLAWMSIGYETMVPPIAILTFYNAVANNGVLLRPRLVKALASNGEIVEEYPVDVIRKSIASDKAIGQIQEMLYKVVNEKGGLGKPAGNPYFHVSGKTGTAQVSQGKAGYKAGRRKYLVSFAGYFPSEAPKYSCIVSIQKDGYASGGTMAGDAFGRIAERIYAKHLHTDLSQAVDSDAVFVPEILKGNITYAANVLNRLGIDSDINDFINEDDYMTWGKSEIKDGQLIFDEMDLDTTGHKVPDVRGMGARDAVYVLENLGLNVRLEGSGKVKSQSIPPGQKARKGNYITLKMKN